jgi:hypothetical protein
MPESPPVTTAIRPLNVFSNMAFKDLARAGGSRR